MNEVPVEVRNISGVVGRRPVTGGGPIAQGAAPQGSRFALFDGAGQAVPFQSRVIARWKDGSARWVLLDFISDPPPLESLTYTLRWTTDSNDETAATLPIISAEGALPLKAMLRPRVPHPADDRLFTVGGRVDIFLRAVDSRRRVFRAVAESVRVEADGPIRRTLALSGSFVNDSGERWFGFRAWAHAYAGLSKVLIEPLVVIDAEKGLLQKIRELTLEVVPTSGVATVRIGGEGGAEHVITDRAENAAPAGDTLRATYDNLPRGRLFQVDDENYVIEGPFQDGKASGNAALANGRKAPGWAEIDDGNGRIAVALRDFWRQWPKSLEVAPASLRIGLLPGFAEGAFAHMEPWYKYDYLFEGDCYRLRTGQARRWQVWLDLDGCGPDLAALADGPLVPAANPTSSVSTGVWGLIAPAEAPAQADYNQWAAKAFQSFVDTTDQSRDYGAMNWGDWHGERRCNWANNEYDVARQMLIEFARTGDPRYFHRGFVTARHTAEVDTIHHVNEDLKRYFLDDVCRYYTNRGITDNYPIRPGMVHAHCVGHVGGFHTIEVIDRLYRECQAQPSGYIYLCLDPYNISHLFTQGMAYCYFLTDDPWLRETLVKIGDNLAKLVEDREFPFAGRRCEGREYGWPILALLAVYELDWNPRYMNAVRMLVDEVLSLQDPVHGGWLRRPGYGSCDCEPQKHEGEGTFLSAIRINALCRYYRLSGDERVLGPVRTEVDHLIEDRWDDESSDWLYYACPKSTHHIRAGVLMMAMANAVDLFNDPRHRRVLEKAWQVLSRQPDLGKLYGPHAYGVAETAAALTERT